MGIKTMSCKISFYTNEQELLKSLLEIHNDNDPIELDPMFFKGNFYKNGVELPRLRYDINPIIDNVEKADAKNLPLESNSIQCMILDPPFLFEKRKREQKNYVSRTHTMFHNGWEELEQCYKGILQEAFRVLKKKGILIFKCQDYTDAKTTMTHCYVWQWAQEIGFYAKDIAILNIPQSKIYNPNLKQRHFRKTHTYFWVFEKGRETMTNKELEIRIRDLEDAFKFQGRQIDRLIDDVTNLNNKIADNSIPHHDFRVGSIVRQKNKKLAYFDKIGTICDINDGEYSVYFQLEWGDSVANFSKKDLELVEVIRPATDEPKQDSRKSLLSKLEQCWNKNPDLRFGQLILNITKNKDFFYTSDSEFEKMIDNYDNKNDDELKCKYRVGDVV